MTNWGAPTTAPVPIVGRVIGGAGRGLIESGAVKRHGGPEWARNSGAARAGLKGERRTAKVLDALATVPGGPTVLHDLRLPIAGRTANVDHAVVTGTRVVLIDSKVWQPGVYFTAFGRNYRGLARVEHTERETMGKARSIFDKYLRTHAAEVVEPVIVAWPAHGKIATTLLRVPGCRVVTGQRFGDDPAAALGVETFTTADASVVSLLTRLVAAK